jgi:GTP-binding protein HflX
VHSALKELKLDSKPALLIFNKIDRLSQEELGSLKSIYTEAIFISALKKVNLEVLKENIYEVLSKDMLEVILKFPFSLMEVVNYIHANCEILKNSYQENEVVYWVRAKKAKLTYLKNRGVEIKEI